MKHIQLSEAFITGHQQIDDENATLITTINNLMDQYVAHDHESCEKVLTNFLGLFTQNCVNKVVIMEDLNFIRKGKLEEYHIDVLNKTLSWKGKCETHFNWGECIMDLVNILFSTFLRYDLAFKEFLVRTRYSEEKKLTLSIV
jgi:hemerythrin